MMDVDGGFEQRMQQYESLLREAEERRLAREIGLTQASGWPISCPAWLWARLSQMMSPEVANSDESLIRHIRYGG